MKRINALPLLVVSLLLVSCSQNSNPCCQCSDVNTPIYANYEQGVCWEDISDNNPLFDDAEEWTDWVENELGDAQTTCSCD
ncbi:MAG: hypothetical protein GC178_01485 [Flavobacteriales bacterium]|nr:hypothetical protein [Flavobacteriales bacterium]